MPRSLVAVRYHPVGLCLRLRRRLRHAHGTRPLCQLLRDSRSDSRTRTVRTIVDSAPGCGSGTGNKSALHGRGGPRVAGAVTPRRRRALAARQHAHRQSDLDLFSLSMAAAHVCHTVHNQRGCRHSPVVAKPANVPPRNQRGNVRHTPTVAEGNGGFRRRRWVQCHVPR